jgi:hypothetical protein
MYFNLQTTFSQTTRYSIAKQHSPLPSRQTRTLGLRVGPSLSLPHHCYPYNYPSRDLHTRHSS